MRAVFVMDRAVSFGLEGILHSEVKAALFGRASLPVYGVITGLGGRDVTYEKMAELVKEGIAGRLPGESNWPNVRVSDRHLVSRKRVEELNGGAAAW
jgi:pyruvate/2-oxoacid:ferredoxin oxidoreductase alpha subunit